MAPSRLLVAAALSAVLLVPTTAEAKAPTPLQAAASVGLRYWGATPCNGQVQILAKRRLPMPAGLSSASNAWATFDSPRGANNLAAPASSYTNCVIVLARWRWPTSATMRQDWDLFCTTMIHELGHLLGKHHDSTPGSVMVPVFTDRSSVPPICRANRPDRSARSARRHR